MKINFSILSSQIKKVFENVNVSCKFLVPKNSAKIALINIVVSKNRYFFSKRDSFDFSSNLDSTTKIRAAYFFIEFEPSEDQKCHFMKPPTYNIFLKYCRKKSQIITKNKIRILLILRKDNYFCVFHNFVPERVNET